MKKPPDGGFCVGRLFCRSVASAPTMGIESRPSGLKPPTYGQAMSVHDDRLLGQAGVAFQRVFDFFLRGGVLLPGLDLLLEHFGP